MNFLKKLISFDEFITPSIIKILYYIFAGLVILMGLYQVFTSYSYYGLGFTQVISGLFFIILGPILVKVYFEILIVLFKIYEKLSTISNKLDSKSNENNITL